MKPRYFMLRLRRDGPLVPGRLRWLDHEPGEPDNKLDRGRLSIFPFVDIAGAEVPPEELFERLYSATDGRSAIAPSHWKYAAPVTEAEYRYQLSRLEWAKHHRPQDPTLRPRRAVDPAQIALPNFDRENAL